LCRWQGSGRDPVAGKKWIDAALVPDSEAHGAATPVGKECFVVYSGDRQRFEMPLSYLKSDIFTELLRMFEEVFDRASRCRADNPAVRCSLHVGLEMEIRCLYKRRWRREERRER
ncbi:hypothetical protein Taro_005941, partial [Colocasia esculenta]|nr:hypothetical protein [Colocasia esculenta]